MKQYKKTFLGSILAFFVGTSCCWLSSVAICLGGATFLGVLTQWIENVQTQLLFLSGFLAIISVYLFWKNQKPWSS